MRPVVIVVDLRTALVVRVRDIDVAAFGIDGHAGGHEEGRLGGRRRLRRSRRSGPRDGRDQAASHVHRATRLLNVSATYKLPAASAVIAHGK
jgi:hypothetical protein